MDAESFKEMNPELTVEVSDEEWAVAVMEEIQRDEKLVEFVGDWRFSLIRRDTLYGVNARLAWEGILTADSGEVLDRLSVDLRALLDRDELPGQESVANRRFKAKEEVLTDFREWLRKWQHKRELDENIPLWARRAGLEVASNLRYRLWDVKECAGEDRLSVRIRTYGIAGVELCVSADSCGIWREARLRWEGVYENAIVLAELAEWVGQGKTERQRLELSC